MKRLKYSILFLFIISYKFSFLKAQDIEKKENWSKIISITIEIANKKQSSSFYNESYKKYIKNESIDTNNTLKANNITNNFIDSIIRNVSIGKLKAFDANGNLISTIVAKRLTYHIDTMITDSPNPNPVIFKITSEDISTIKLKEKLFFDYKKLAVFSKITEITFFLDKYGDDGQFFGKRVLYSVKLD